jgi:hypothetical protein
MAGTAPQKSRYYMNHAEPDEELETDLFGAPDSPYYLRGERWRAGYANPDDPSEGHFDAFDAQERELHRRGVVLDDGSYSTLPEHAAEMQRLRSENATGSNDDGHHSEISSDTSDTPPAVELGNHPSVTENLRIPDIYPQWYQGSSLQTNLVHNYHQALGGAQCTVPHRMEADFGSPSVNTVLPGLVSAPNVPPHSPLAAGQRLLHSTSKAAPQHQGGH